MANWFEEIFAINEIKNTVLWTYVINDLNETLVILLVKKLLEHFMKKNYKKLIKKNLGQKK